MTASVVKVLLCALFSCLTAVASINKVSVNKCCSMNQYMLKTNNTCKDETKVPWTETKIFAIRKYLPPGQIPKHWDIAENSIVSCDGNKEPRLITYHLGSYLMFLNGSLFSLEYNRLVHPSKYCIDYNTALVCPEEIESEERKVFVKKCCGNHTAYSEHQSKCLNMNSGDYEINVGSDFALGAGFPGCDKQMFIAGKLNGSAVLERDGSVFINETKTKLPAEGFCLEHVLENADRYPSIFACRTEDVIVKRQPQHRDLRFILYPIGLALSAVFLAATLVAGSLLPASHHVLHWRCQTNHVACLLVGNVLLCIVQLSGGTLGSKPCFSIAIAMHFLFLSAFFWLNTMCFNIWWTFRDLRPQSLEKSQERWRLRLYEIYAWGVPLLIASIGAILDSVEKSDYLIQPGFGTKNCWFAGNREILAYFLGPVAVLLIINLVLFAATARELTCGLWKRELVKSTTERAALGRVCMKLVVVMGVTWIAEVVSWAVEGPQEIWYLTDLINCLQGVFIFIVVGLQPQVLTAVKRVWCLRKNRTAGAAGTTNHHSSSSQGLPSMGDTVTHNSITNGTTKSVPLETSC